MWLVVSWLSALPSDVTNSPQLHLDTPALPSTHRRHLCAVYAHRDCLHVAVVHNGAVCVCGCYVEGIEAILPIALIHSSLSLTNQNGRSVPNW